MGASARDPAAADPTRAASSYGVPGQKPSPQPPCCAHPSAWRPPGMGPSC